jgi:hypothetical protein
MKCKKKENKGDNMLTKLTEEGRVLDNNMKRKILGGASCDSQCDNDCGYDSVIRKDQNGDAEGKKLGIDLHW